MAIRIINTSEVPPRRRDSEDVPLYATSIWLEVAKALKALRPGKAIHVDIEELRDELGEDTLERTYEIFKYHVKKKIASLGLRCDVGRREGYSGAYISKRQ